MSIPSTDILKAGAECRISPIFHGRDQNLVPARGAKAHGIFFDRTMPLDKKLR